MVDYVYSGNYYAATLSCFSSKWYFFKLLPDLNTVLYPAFLYTFRNFGDTQVIHGKVIVVDSFFVSRGVSDSPFVLVFSIRIFLTCAITRFTSDIT